MSNAMLLEMTETLRPTIELSSRRVVVLDVDMAIIRAGTRVVQTSEYELPDAIRIF